MSAITLPAKLTRTRLVLRSMVIGWPAYHSVLINLALAEENNRARGDHEPFSTFSLDTLATNWPAGLGRRTCRRPRGGKITTSAAESQAASNGSGSSGQAQAIAKTNFAGLNSAQAMATSPVSEGGAASAFAQVGNAISLPNSINAGQGFSVVSTFAAGPLMVGRGSMGAGYGGTGVPLTYQQSADFTYNPGGGSFLLYLLGSQSLGTGFDSAEFDIALNGNLLDSQIFNDLASAQGFFSNHLITLALLAGLNDVQLTFSETLSSGEGFSFDYAAANNTTPLAASWTMMLLGLACLGFVAYQRKKNMPSLEAA